MSMTPSEETDLVLEELRLLRAEMHAGFDAIDARFGQVLASLREVRQEITNCKCELGGLEFDTIPEFYTANFTVARFVDFEWRFVLSSREERA